jgi:energy-coupling factor transporter ATP-binding protein EcfA2
MIKSLQFTSGFPTAFPHLKNRKFVFTDKLNVLFGDVGSGKSTSLKTMAAYCGIATGGWTSISEPSHLAYSNASHFPFCYRKYTPNSSDAIVEWGGEPTFYNDSDALSKTDNTWFYKNSSQSSDGITTEAEQMEVLATKPSSGQYRIHKINKIMKIIQHPPDTLIIPPHIKNIKDAQLELDYYKTLPRDGKITLLLDEPEKSLSIPKQIELFKVLITLTEHFQVIITTHSPFILDFKKVNIIDFTPGYMKEVAKAIRDVKTMK